MAIVLALGWVLFPPGYEALIQWLAPELGNYVRPTLIMVNLMIVDPTKNPVILAAWGAAGFIGGVFAGTKKGAFVVGLVTWLSCLGILAFSVYQMMQTGFSTGSMPPMPPGSSILDILSIPLVQSMISQLLPMLLSSASSGGSFDPTSLIMSLAIYVIVPLVTVIVAGMVGATIRPKEE